MYKGWKWQSYEGEVNGRKITELETHRIKQQKKKSAFWKTYMTASEIGKGEEEKQTHNLLANQSFWSILGASLRCVMWKCWRAEPSLRWTKLLINIVTRAIYAVRGQEGKDAAALGELHKVQEGLQLPSNSAGGRNIYLHKSQTIH